MRLNRLCAGACPQHTWCCPCQIWYQQLFDDQWLLQGILDKLRRLVRESNAQERCAKEALEGSCAYETTAARRLACEAERVHTLELMRLSDVRQLSALQQQLSQALHARVTAARPPAPPVAEQRALPQPARWRAEPRDASLTGWADRPRLSGIACGHNAGRLGSGRCSPSELDGESVSLRLHDAPGRDSPDVWRVQADCAGLKSAQGHERQSDPGDDGVAGLRSPAARSKGGPRARLPERPSPRRLFTALDAAFAAATAELQPIGADAAVRRTIL